MLINLWVFTLAIFSLLGACRGDKTAKFPLQLSFNVTITAHQIEEASEFPPRTRSMYVRYDYINGRVRADIAAGYEAEKTYIRRYDEKKEYMVRHAPLNDCKRSYLGEIMPYPLIPNTEYVHSRDAISGHAVDYYLHEDFETRVHMYFRQDTDWPVRVVQETVTAGEGAAPGVSVQMLTYDFTEVELGQPEAAHFELPLPYLHEQCDRHVGGFPYIHAFHYFVKF